MSPEFKSLREKIAYEKQERQKRYAEFSQWVEEAHKIAMEAAKKATVIPMTVVQHSNPMDDKSPVERQWHVEGGVCGFAWITVKPANSSFGVWAKKNKGWKSYYGGGISLYIQEFGQSMQLKEAYAHAYANVLREHGITAYVNSRID